MSWYWHDDSGLDSYVEQPSARQTFQLLASDEAISKQRELLACSRRHNGISSTDSQLQLRLEPAPLSEPLFFRLGGQMMLLMTVENRQERTCNCRLFNQGLR